MPAIFALSILVIAVADVTVKVIVLPCVAYEVSLLFEKSEINTSAYMIPLVKEVWLYTFSFPAASFTRNEKVYFSPLFGVFDTSYDAFHFVLLFSLVNVTLCP